MKKFKVILPLILIFVSLSASSYAGIGSIHSMHNDEIDTNIREDIHKLNNKIIQSLRDSDSAVLYELFTDQIKNQNGMRANTEKMYQQLKPITEKTSFKIFNDYYVTAKLLGETLFSIPSETKEKFFISLKATSEEAYISLLESEGSENGILLVFIYKKINNSWRVETVHVGDLKLGNKSAVAWYEEALSFYKKEQLVPALVRVGLANKCLRPAPFIQYEKEAEIISLGKKIQDELTKKTIFPWKLAEIKSVPEIYGIRPDFVDGEPVAMVNYITKIPLNNPSMLQQEVEAIFTGLKLKFPGIDSSSYVYFTAFSEYPADPKKQYERYGLRVATAQ